MLVLTRRKGESIIVGIDGGVEIEIIELRGDRVRIGITAPPEIAVHRREVYEAIQRQQNRETTNANFRH